MSCGLIWSPVSEHTAFLMFSIRERLSGVSRVSRSLALKSAASPPLKRGEQPARLPSGLRRDVVEMDVQSLDPVSLAPLVDLGRTDESRDFRRQRVSWPSQTPSSGGSRGAGGCPGTEQRSGSSACDLFLKKERIVGVAATRESLIVTIADDRGIDWKPAKGEKEEQPSWLRVDCYPSEASGRAWSYRAEGWMGGNPVIDGDIVSFSGYERGSGAPMGGKVGSWPEPFTREGFSLKRFSHDRVTGLRLDEEPLLGIGPWSSHRGYCRLFPGRKAAISDDELLEYRITGSTLRTKCPWK